MNWPSEPIAVARPMAHERRSSGTSRENAAITIVNDAPESPSPIRTPPLSWSATGLVLTAISAVPPA